MGRIPRRRRFHSGPLLVNRIGEFLSPNFIFGLYIALYDPGDLGESLATETGHNALLKCSPSKSESWTILLELLKRFCRRY